VRKKEREGRGIAEVEIDAAPGGGGGKKGTFPRKKICRGWRRRLILGEHLSQIKEGKGEKKRKSFSRS